MKGDEKKRMKSAARLYAVQALFQMEASGQSVEAVTAEFETHRFGAVYDDDEMADGDAVHFRAVVGHAVNIARPSGPSARASWREPPTSASRRAAAPLP